MIPILLTSTIKPHETDGIFEVRQTENERFLEYKHALAFYRRKLRKTPLVFADNSRSELIHQLSENQTLEVINIPIADESKVLGKGYGEGLLINEALEKSQTLQHSEAFIKITGRYRIYNVNRFIALLHASKEAYDFVALDFQHFGPAAFVNPTYMFYSKTGFWNEHLASVYQNVDDKNGPAFEKLVTEGLLSAASRGKRIGIFPFPALLLKINPASGEYSIRTRELIIGRAKTALALAFKKRLAIRALEPYVG